MSTNVRYASNRFATAAEHINPRVVVQRARRQCAAATAVVNIAAVLAGRSRVAYVRNRKSDVICAVDFLVIHVEGSNNAYPVDNISV